MWKRTYKLKIIKNKRFVKKLFKILLSWFKKMRNRDSKSMLKHRVIEQKLIKIYLWKK